jgi:hypothetical protein
VWDVALISFAVRYPMWTYNDTVPGPFIRAREGDTVEIRYTNKDSAGLAHNIGSLPLSGFLWTHPSNFIFNAHRFPRGCWCEARVLSCVLILVCLGR